jgi:hypothetical protein
LHNDIDTIVSMSENSPCQPEAQTLSRTVDARARSRAQMRDFTSSAILLPSTITETDRRADGKHDYHQSRG